MTSFRLLFNSAACVLLGTMVFAQKSAQPNSTVQNFKPATDSRILDMGSQKKTLAPLPETALESILAAIGRENDAYSAKPQAHGFQFLSGRAGVSAELTKDAVTFMTSGDRWSLSLISYGVGDKLRPVSPAVPRGHANRVEYRRGDLTEWYLNGPMGVEQGVTIARAPRYASGRLLTLTFTVSGDLSATVDPDGLGLTLKKNQTTLLHYSGLRVNDARGRDLPARLELAEDRLLLQVEASGAAYPITIDPYVQSAKLTSSAGLSNLFALFGAAISGDGNTVVTTDTDNAVDVFIKPAKGWASATETAKLTCPEAGEFTFPTSVAVSGDGTTIVGGWELANAGGSGRGMACIFAKPAGGWVATPDIAQLTASDASDSDRLGSSVAISSDGSTIASGLGNFTRDAAYVYVKPSTGWATTTETAELTVSSVRNGFAEGSLKMSADGSVISSGAWLATVGSNAIQGAAYVFVRPTGGWISETDSAQLIASDGAAGDGLGLFADISGDGNVVITGSSGAKIGANVEQGAAYVFVQPSAGWSGLVNETAKLTASDGVAGDQLGRGLTALSADGNTALVGAFLAQIGTNVNQGAAYVFTKPQTGWASETEKFKIAAADGVAQSTFGEGGGISQDASTILVTAPFVFATNPVQGAAYIFTGSPQTPTASLSTASLSFGSQAAGTASATQQVTLSNTGGADLHVASVSAGTGFSTTTNCVTASPIAAGGSCTEDVAFVPGSVTSFDGNLTFTDDSGGAIAAVQTVGLSGTGVRAGSSITISAGAAITGFPVTVSYTVSPQAGDTLTPSGKVTLATNETHVQTCSQSAPTGSCSFTFSTSGLEMISASYEGDANFNGSESSFNLNVAVTPAGITNVISEELTLGCIDRSGIAGALDAKLAAAQADIAAGQTQQAINTLKALLNQLQAQIGKHVKATCTDSSGNTIDLVGLVKALLSSLGVNIAPDPILGNVLSGSGTGLSGLAVNLLNSRNATVATAVTDVTGFYYFPATNTLTTGTSYTVKVVVPKGYKGTTPGSQAFTWKAAAIALSNFVLN